MNRDRLKPLADLARLRADKTAADLARHMVVIRDLEKREAALRAPLTGDTEDISMIRAMERHANWRQQKLVELTRQLAIAQAAAQPARERYAKDLARQKVMEKLSKKP